jgi:hypothetical protein
VFGARVQVVLAVPDERFARTLTTAGFADVRTNADGLSVGVEDPRSSTPAIVRRLVEAGADIIAVAAEQPPLEDVYLRLLNGKHP